jgi:hypothetical protein
VQTTYQAPELLAAEPPVAAEVVVVEPPEELPEAPLAADPPAATEVEVVLEPPSPPGNMLFMMYGISKLCPEPPT